MRLLRSVGALALVGAACLAGCGGGTPDSAVVVRIGDLALTKATVDHVAHVIERGGPAGGFRGKPPGRNPRERALDLLISSHWLVNEASRQGVPVTGSALEEALAERQQEPGFRRQLRHTGETIAEAKLEMGAELAGESVREALAARAAQVTPRQVLDYYRSNPASFETLEVRATDLVENLPTKEAAAALVKRTGVGRRFSALAYHEKVVQSGGFVQTPEKVKVVNAIFAARPGTVSEPMLLNGHWAVFVVRKTTPPRLEPFSDVRAVALRDLEVQRQHEIAERFDHEYVVGWTAQTRCKAGWLAPGCPQVHKLLGRYEDPFSRRAHPLLAEQ